MKHRKITSNLLVNVNRDVFRCVVIEQNILILTSHSCSTFRAACSLHTQRRYDFNLLHSNQVNSRVDLLFFTCTLYSLFPNSVRCVIDAQASSIASCSRAIDRMSCYFVHSFCVEVSVVRHSSLLINYTLDYMSIKV